ncbi:hypothetical protein FPSE_06421, partial [Fusarium pseudograminearum CS3096]
ISNSKGFLRYLLFLYKSSLFKFLYNKASYKIGFIIIVLLISSP